MATLLSIVCLPADEKDGHHRYKPGYLPQTNWMYAFAEQSNTRNDYQLPIASRGIFLTIKTLHVCKPTYWATRVLVVNGN